MLKSEKNRQIIGIILPAYNEGRVIGKILNELPRSITADGKSFRIKIVVVDDGSTDNTINEVKKIPDVELISHLLNSGVGAASRTGMHYAYEIGCQFAVVMDSDGQHSIEDMKRLISAIVRGNSDLIIGSRLKHSGGNMPTVKKIGNIGLSIITFLLLGVYVSDSQSGMRAFNRKALEEIDFHSNGYAFCSEMIWKAHQADLRISEVPIEAIYTDYSLSSGRGQKNITGALEIIKQLIKRRFLSLING